MYSTGTNNKVSFVERFNRTLGDKFKKVLYLNNVCNTDLSKIIKTYNKTIKMKPIEVNKSNEKELLSTVYNYDMSNAKPKFEVNDKVRLSSIIDAYRNKLKTNWSKEIFTVDKLLKSNIIYYKINDVDGKFYEEELQLSAL